MDVRILLISKRESPPTTKANKACSAGKPVAHFWRTHVASIPKKVSEERTGKPVAETLITQFQENLTQPSRTKTRIARQPTARNRQSNKARCDGYVIKKKRTHDARHGLSMRQCMYYKAHDMLRKARKHKRGVTKPFWKDGTMMTNTASLCRILGGLKNRSFNMMQSHWKIIPAWLDGKKEVGTENPGTFL